jgi:hypothetical protein
MTLYGDTSPVVVAPSNATTVPAQLTTYDGWSVASGFVAGTANSLAPNFTPTARGLWGALQMTPPVIDTVVGSAAMTIDGTVLLDADNAIVLCHNATNFFTFAINSSGDVGALNSIGTFASATGAGIYRVSATVYMAGFRHSAGNFTFRCGTLTPSTLAIANGVATTIVGALHEAATQLSANYYLAPVNAATGLQGVYINGTTITCGAQAASGSIGDSTANDFKIARVTDTQGLVVAITNGGGTGTTRALGARTVDVAITTATLTVNALVVTGVNNLTTSLNVLIPFLEGSNYAAVATASPATSGAFHPITVSASVPAIGAATTRANDVPVAQNLGTWIYKTSGVTPLKYDATRAIFGHLAAGPYAMQMSGGALSFGATLALAAAKNFVWDFNQTNAFALSAGAMDRLALDAGTTLTSAEAVVTTASVVATSELADSAVKYGGTWYTWVLPAGMIPVFRQIWILPVGNNIVSYGPIQ